MHWLDRFRVAAAAWRMMERVCRTATPGRSNCKRRVVYVCDISGVWSGQKYTP